jgi:hypothetical protein
MSKVPVKIEVVQEDQGSFIRQDIRRRSRRAAANRKIAEKAASLAVPQGVSGQEQEERILRARLGTRGTLRNTKGRIQFSI